MYAKLILVAMLLMCAGPWLAAGETEKDAIAAVEKMGGKLRRASTEPDAPIIGVQIHQTTIVGEDLRHLSAFKDLEYVIFFTVTIKGEGLKHLKDLKKLHTLSLGFTNIPSEKTWDDLKELKQLKEIGIGYTEIAGKRDPRAKIKEVLPQVKTIGPLVNVPAAKGKEKEKEKDKDKETK